MKNDELLKFGISHSCQVFQLTNNFESACGFILKQENFSLFLTVDHLFKGIAEYAQGSIPIKINPNHKTLVLKKTFLPVGISDNEIIDLRYCELKPTDSPSSYVDGKEVKQSLLRTYMTRILQKNIISLEGYTLKEVIVATRNLITENT